MVGASFASDVSRRSLLRGGGSLVLFFSLAPKSFGQEAESKVPVKAPPLPGSLKQTPWLDAWVRIDADGAITVMTGKCELGQGAKTALLQIAAEQLAVEPHAITLITADTRFTPNEGFTAGSHTMQDSGTAIMHATAQVREKLIDLAAQRMSAPRENLRAEAGAIVDRDGRRTEYKALVDGLDLHIEAQPVSALVPPAAHRIIGTALPRVDIPAKLTGAPAYIQDMRPDGLVHARVVRPPSYGAILASVETGAVERMPGVLKVVRDGSYLAVIAEREIQAIRALRALQAAANWTETNTLPAMNAVFEGFRAMPTQDRTSWEKNEPAPAGTKQIRATFHRDYQQHGSIGPSCGLALFKEGRLTVWSHAQGMFPLRQGIAQMLGLPAEHVDCIHAEGAGCYGHNGADDAAADAAILARAFPGRPVRVQYMREDENIWEPKGSAMMVDVAASLDETGHVVDWNYEVWSNTHSTRPPGAGQLMPAWFLVNAFKPDRPAPIPLPEGDGDRNSQPLYGFPRGKAVYHFVPDMPLRVSALRGLGAYTNVFAIESMVDELAAAAGTDPVTFRLNHLTDDRARDVIERAAREFGWSTQQPRKPHVGRGFAFARYKNIGAYCAIACELSVDPETGRVMLGRFDVAVDSGTAVNPDGIRNQIEGGVVQSSSWTLVERVAFIERRILARDWSTYPILRFHAVPESVHVHLIDRPGQPFLGTGEAAQGPTAAAIANAITDALGVRPRHLPLLPERLREALAATTAEVRKATPT